MPRARSLPAAHICREPCAPDIPHAITSNWGSKGHTPIGRECRGGGPPLPPAAQAISSYNVNHYWTYESHVRLAFSIRSHQIGVPRGTRPLAGGAGVAVHPC